MRVNHFFSRGRVVVFILIPRDLKWGPTKTHTHTDNLVLIESFEYVNEPPFFFLYLIEGVVIV